MLGLLDYMVNLQYADASSSIVPEVWFLGWELSRNLALQMDAIFGGPRTGLQVGKNLYETSDKSKMACELGSHGKHHMMMGSR